MITKSGGGARTHSLSRTYWMGKNLKNPIDKPSSLLGLEPGITKVLISVTADKSAKVLDLVMAYSMRFSFWLYMPYFETN